MSDLGTTDPTTTTTPDAPAAPETPADYKALYERQVKETERERNLYKPAQRLLNKLDEGARAAVQQLAELAEAGDPDAIAEWALYQVQAVTGKDAAAYIAAKQAATEAADNPAVPELKPGLTAEQVEEIVQSRMTAEATRQQGVATITAQLKDAGYEFNSAPAKTIISYCVDNGLDLPDGVKWFEAEIEVSALERAKRAAAVGADTGTPAPQGAQQGSLDDGMKEGESPEEYSRRRGLARLRKDVTS